MKRSIKYWSLGLGLYVGKTCLMVLISPVSWQSVDPLIETLVEFSDSQTQILMSYETRMEFEKHAQLEKDFFNKMKKSFYEIKIPKDELHPDFSSDDIHVLRFKKR